MKLENVTSHTEKKIRVRIGLQKRWSDLRVSSLWNTEMQETMSHLSESQRPVKTIRTKPIVPPSFSFKFVVCCPQKNKRYHQNIYIYIYITLYHPIPLLLLTDFLMNILVLHIFFFSFLLKKFLLFCLRVYTAVKEKMLIESHINIFIKESMYF